MASFVSKPKKPQQTSIDLSARLLLLPDWDGLLFKELGGLPCLCVCCWTERRPVLERRLVVQKKGAICGRTRLSTRTKSCPPGELSFEMVRGHEIAARNVSLRERDVWVPPQEPEDTRGDNETNSRGATARDPTDTNNILT